MVQLLTNYLFQFKKVSVPHVGTIQLIQNPPQLFLVDKKLGPPGFSIIVKNEEPVSEHQLNYLVQFLNAGNDIVLGKLDSFGRKLLEKINGPGFEWKGIGTFFTTTQTIPLKVSGLDTIKAEKIIRHDSQHNILVGDKEMTSVQMSERLENPLPVSIKPSTSIIIGWIVFGLSILAIMILLYTGKFKTSAAGSKQSPTGFIYPGSHFI